MFKGRSEFSGKDEAHSAFVTEAAKRAFAWLKDRAKERLSRMATLSSKGMKMTFNVMQEQNQYSPNVSFYQLRMVVFVH